MLHNLWIAIDSIPLSTCMLLAKTSSRLCYMDMKSTPTVTVWSRAYLELHIITLHDMSFEEVVGTTSGSTHIEFVTPVLKYG